MDIRAQIAASGDEVGTEVECAVAGLAEYVPDADSLLTTLTALQILPQD